MDSSRSPRRTGAPSEASSFSLSVFLIFHCFIIRIHKLFMFDERPREHFELSGAAAAELTAAATDRRSLAPRFTRRRADRS